MRRTRGIGLASVMGVASLAAVLVCPLARAQAGGPPRTAAQAAEAAKTSAEAAKASAEAAKASAEAAKASASRSDAVATRAEASLQKADMVANRASLVISVAEFAVVVITIGAVVGIFGWAAVNLRRLRRKGLSVRTIEHAVADAHDALVKHFAEMPASTVVGAPTRRVPQIAYDDDSLVVLGDRLGISGKDRKALAETLAQVGRYWLRAGDIPRARARADRARELNPKSFLALRVAERALWQEVAAEMAANPSLAFTDPTVQSRLAKASDLITQCISARDGAFGSDLKFDQATIEYLRGDLDLSIKQYEAALALDTASGKQPRDYNIDYNLACAYAKKSDASSVAKMVSLLKELTKEKVRADPDGFLEPVDYRADIRADRAPGGSFSALTCKAAEELERLCRPEGVGGAPGAVAAKGPERRESDAAAGPNQAPPITPETPTPR